MIESFNLNKNNPTSFKWAKDVKFLQDEIKFEPGLNIIFGPNGSGKSTLIDIMASHLFAKQSGRSVVTATAINNLITGSLEDTPILPASIRHDGQPVMYLNPRDEIGLYKGHFDDDFISEGLDSLGMRNQSVGQRTSERVNEVVQILMKKDLNKDGKNKNKAEFPEKILWKLSKSGVNNYWVKKLDFAESMLNPTIEIGQKTILMDEPESGFSMLWQSGLWANVLSSECAKEFQIIVATHSPFALNVPGAHYIDIEQGYREKCLNELRLALN